VPFLERLGKTPMGVNFGTFAGRAAFDNSLFYIPENFTPTE
jgi:hypothetical protein